MAELACRVGCGAGFAGDRVDPAVRMAASGEVDAIALECLAERTLLPALKARAADPRAGYDPRAAISLWKKMGDTGGSEPPKFMSTHPPRAERMQDLTVYSQKVMPLYQQAKK